MIAGLPCVFKGLSCKTERPLFLKRQVIEAAEGVMVSATKNHLQTAASERDKI